MSLKSHVITGVIVGLGVGSWLTGFQANAVTAPKLQTQTISVAGGSWATCPSGWLLTGGGYSIPADSISATSSTQYKVISSYPVSADKWTVNWVVLTGTYNSTSKQWTYTSRQSGNPATVYAVCAKVG